MSKWADERSVIGVGMGIGIESRNMNLIIVTRDRLDTRQSKRRMRTNPIMITTTKERRLNIEYR